MKREKRRELSALDREKQLPNGPSPGFWLLVGRKPGSYVPRTPVLHLWKTFHTDLDTLGPRMRPEELVDREKDFDPKPVTPVSETRIAVKDRGRTGHRLCCICNRPFTARNFTQAACSRICGVDYRAQKRLGTTLAEQKARVKALRCSPTTRTASESARPPSASPAAPSAATPAPAAEASGD